MENGQRSTSDSDPASGTAAATAGRPIAAFFDLDKTITARSASFAFNKPFLDEGMMSRTAILRLTYAQIVYMLSGADDEQMARIREQMAEITTGWSPQQVRTIVDTTLSELVEPYVFAEAAELLQNHRELGHFVVILSASGEEMVAPIAEMLGVEHFRGTRMALDAEGRYSGEVEFYCQGENKAEAMRRFAEKHGISLDDCYAYSDSATDLPMLSAVGHPTAVNPDRALRKEALSRGWPVLSFSNPIPLKARIHPPGRKAAAGIGSLIAAAAVGGAIAIAASGRSEHSHKPRSNGKWHLKKS